MIDTLQALIDEAASLCKSEAALAARMGVTRQRLSEWKHNKRPCPTEVIAQLASITQASGEEARRVLADAECRKGSNAGKAEVMRRAFFGALALGVALCGANPTDAAASVTRERLTLYTLCTALRAALRWPRLAAQALASLSRAAQQSGQAMSPAVRM